MSLCDAPGSCQAPVNDEFGERKTILCFPHQAKLVIATQRWERARWRASGFELLPLRGCFQDIKCVKGVKSFQKPQTQSLMTSCLLSVAWSTFCQPDWLIKFVTKCNSFWNVLNQVTLVLSFNICLLHQKLPNSIKRDDYELIYWHSV